MAQLCGVYPEAIDPTDPSGGISIQRSAVAKFLAVWAGHMESNATPQLDLRFTLGRDSCTHGKELGERSLHCSGLEQSGDDFGMFYDLGRGSLGETSASFPYTASKNLALAKLVPFPPIAQKAAPPAITTNPPVSAIFVADSNLKLQRSY
jgi:hypothetical protein